eukprot:360184-Chlamydomonas_euryale.AAC.6
MGDGRGRKKLLHRLCHCRHLRRRRLPGLRPDILRHRHSLCCRRRPVGCRPTDFPAAACDASRIRARGRRRTPMKAAPGPQAAAA